MKPNKLQTDAQTSDRMRRVRQHGTRPELLVRRRAHALGLRFRVKNRDLPGSPDLANRSRRWTVFVHGCFWHDHPGCPRATKPKRNAEFWTQKLAANRERDARRAEELRLRGYRVIVIWECEAESIQTIDNRLNRLRTR